MKTDIETAAAAAAEARRRVRPFDMPQGLGGAPFADAYAFQDAYVAAVGKPVAGYKLAVNGAPQQAHFGVSEPAWARIFAGEVYPSGAALPLAGFDSVSIEPEICAVLGAGVELFTGPVDRAEALQAIDCFRPAIELIDQRGVPMPQLDLAQAIALNVFNAGIVLGEGRIAPEALELPALTVALTLDGTPVAEVTGAAPQDPVEAVAWLLSALHARGLHAAPGMVVMCGTHLPLRTLEPAVRSVAVTMRGLGEVAFTLTD
ncbi:MAG: 2-keto-4-pentenoate hydratase [Pseudodonghicola sp.]